MYELLIILYLNILTLQLKRVQVCRYGGSLFSNPVCFFSVDFDISMCRVTRHTRQTRPTAIYIDTVSLCSHYFLLSTIWPPIISTLISINTVIELTELVLKLFFVVILQKFSCWFYQFLVKCVFLCYQKWFSVVSLGCIVGVWLHLSSLYYHMDACMYCIYMFIQEYLQSIHMYAYTVFSAYIKVRRPASFSHS